MVDLDPGMFLGRVAHGKRKATDCREAVFGFGKRGLVERGLFRTPRLENKGDSDHLLETLETRENSEILEILEIPPVARPLSS